MMVVIFVCVLVSGFMVFIVISILKKIDIVFNEKEIKI